MKISELISALEALKEIHGDVPVYKTDWEMGSYYPGKLPLCFVKHEKEFPKGFRGIGNHNINPGVVID